jgi:hypothetical protein
MTASEARSRARRASPMKRNNIWMLTDAAGNGTRLRYRNSHTLARAARLRELERFINDVLGFSELSRLQHRMVAASVFGFDAVEKIWKPQ